MDDTLHHKNDEHGFVIGWRYKYKFEAGYYDEEMTFGEAKKRAEELHQKHPDMTFWPKKKSIKAAFYNPDAH